MKQLLIVSCLSLLTAQATAYELEYDVGVGVSKFTNKNSKLWQTEGFPSNMKMIGKAGEFGVSGNIWESQHHKFGLDWRAGFTYLGAVHTNALVPSFATNVTQGSFVGQDFVGANPNHLCNGACTNLEHYDGSGHDFGFPLTLQPYTRIGNLKVSLIGGAYIHKAKWTESQTHVDTDAGAGIQQWTNGFSDNKSGWQVGKVLGFSVRKGDVTIKYQYFIINPKGNDPLPAAFQRAHMITVGYSFK